MGAAALSSLWDPGLIGSAQAAEGLPGFPNFAPKAKRAIYLFLPGGPSHIDTFDYKPELRDIHGKELPDSIRRGQRITGMTSKQKTLPVCPTKYKFTKQKNNADGVWVSELLPHTATVAKELCVVHTAFT